MNVNVIGFEYSVRTSTRCKRILLKISPTHGVEVVVPKGVSHAKAHVVVQNRKEWIENRLERFRARGLPCGRSIPVPHRIDLPSVGRRVRVEHHPGKGRSRVREHGDIVQVFSEEGESGAWKHLLMKWLKTQGRVHLVDWVQTVADETGLRYTSVRIGAQRTRWGSYSAKGTVSLNCRLLFFPAELVRYVLVHELCHSLHPDHSPRFRARLESLISHSRDLEQELKQSWRYVPAWAA
ncbi:MAG: M48 family metallopeptidase [Desulfovibrionales bacterium]